MIRTQMAMRFVKVLIVLMLFLVAVSTSFLVYTYNSIPKIESRISVLVLGTGGEGHTAPDLTDTMMQVVFDNNSKKASVISIPRDIWIPEIRAKLNTAYHYGGYKMADDSVTSVTSIPVKYNVLINFTVFKELIDSIGGIEVNVENSFVDEKYPIAGLENDSCNGDKTFSCRYEKLVINQGRQTMDGELALKFVRSRNSKGDEGTDIAREKRQQKVINAIKERVLSSKVLLNPKAIEKLYKVTLSNVKSDMDRESLLILSKFVLESNFNVNYMGIPEDMLTVSQNNVKYDKQYVFLPKSGSWKTLQEWILNKI